MHSHWCADELNYMQRVYFTCHVNKPKNVLERERREWGEKTNQPRKRGILLLMRPAPCWCPCPIPKLGARPNGDPLPWKGWGQAIAYDHPSDKPHRSSKNTQVHAHIRTHLHTHALTHTCSYQYPQTHLHVCIQILTLIHPHPLLNSHIRTADTHAYMCTHIRTRTRSYTQFHACTQSSHPYLSLLFQVFHLWGSFAYTCSL